MVCGLAHNDLHGGNLLIDSQGLVWLIDFATVKSDQHVLIDSWHSRGVATCSWGLKQLDVRSYEPTFWEVVVRYLCKKLCHGVSRKTRCQTGYAKEDLKKAFAEGFLELKFVNQHTKCPFSFRRLVGPQLLRTFVRI